MMIIVSCGSDGTFRINGRIDNFGTGNLRVVYFANGAVQSVVAPAVDGKFSMIGRIDRPAFARIYTGNGTVVGRFIVKPGESIEAVLDITNPTAMKFDGNDDSERLAKFIDEHASMIENGDTKGLNTEIEKYVRANPRHLVSGVLMSDYFNFHGNETLAAELISLLHDNVTETASLKGLLNLTATLAIPTDSLRLEPFTIFSSSDSLTTINPQTHPHTWIMFTDASSRKADSITDVLAELSKLTADDKLMIADISCDPDTASWHSDLRRQQKTDTLQKKIAKKVNRYWTPAPFNISGLEEIPIADVPWFVVADSTRQVLYRGSSITAARNALK